jgi:hypothetical protein
MHITEVSSSSLFTLYQYWLDLQVFVLILVDFSYYHYHPLDLDPIDF